jgi:hypothetical protein
MSQRSMYLLISGIQVYCEYNTEEVEFTTEEVQMRKRR